LYLSRPYRGVRPLTPFAQVFRNALLNKEVAIKAINDPFIDLEYM